MSYLKDRMKVIAEMPDDAHKRVMEKTGYWGSKAAGCIFLCTATKNLMLVLRSRHVSEPHTWGMVGGAIDKGESTRKALKREIFEEVGHRGSPILIPLSKFEAKGFVYYNFVAAIPNQFIPKLNDEADDYKWFNVDMFPTPLHPGVKRLLKNQSDMQILKSLTRNRGS